MTASVSAFLAVATLLIIAPGPDSLLVIRNTLRRGQCGGLVTVTGTLTGLSLWALAAVLGLTSLIQASQVGYAALHLAGGAYLVWLGVASFRTRHPAGDTSYEPDTAGTRAHDGRVGLLRLYAMGLVSNVLNPKIGVFFVAFLPAFIPAGVPIGTTAALLGLMFVVETGLWLVLLSVLVRRGTAWMRRPRVRQVIERATGVVLIGFGVRLATEARALT